MKNDNLLKDLYLEILLAGNHFDGSLNFGAVVLIAGDTQYPLDIDDTTGYLDQETKAPAIPTYTLVSEFVSIEQDTKEMFEDWEQYNFSINLADFLKSKGLRAITNIYRDDLDKDSKITMGRVKSMTLRSKSDKDFAIEVKQDWNL